MNIGEFARRTGLSVSAIRFYGDRNLLVPAEIDPSSGYRSYTTDQVDEARVIADLRRMDMPLAQIERVLESPDEERRAQILDHVERLEVAVHRAHVIAHSFDIQSTSKEKPMTTTSPTTAASAILDARHLGHAIEQILPSVGRDSTMPHLMCVLIESKDGSIRFVATDRHRLSVRDVVPSSESGAFRAVVAADTIRECVTVLDERTSASKDLLVLQRRDLVIEVTASCDGPVAHVALDPSYGADALRSAVGVETVVEIADPLEPVIFRSADDGTFTSLLMPVKLD